MFIIQTPYLTSEQKQIVCQLWNREYPANLRHHTLADFENYLNGLSSANHYLLTTDVQIQAWAVTFIRDGERWFAVIVDSRLQKKGIGTILLTKLREKENRLCGWVVDHDLDIKQDGTFYRSPIQFYLKNGFTICPGVRLETEKLSAVKIIWQQSSNK